ncbi:type I DNA topoisomerase [Ihubacter massiliensis]|uniref:DNA topoisomerase 1 n=1 Tax=Hominibacterium faecale TaxID=2839743 RepID=A0A9J6QXZ9_9FIRM|nr:MULTISPECIES: type I DNA topoisomerase [Eubacteriales Family XIII. Incertae Sedis]MCI7302356.1 type I DNA topoisomerase [Clostridia bacterium]MCO7123713.1 type I DNA topoisomerase [Ihubacter massiliensis]MCU7380367.1 type I DNA topoisomerase [Hominibacterium faecale]MDY3011023.1 type I DNA topoisomerase [Clostridiales Family XIII bacterium]
MAAAKKNLVIVESPSKAKTIGKFLGSKYKVIASVGHVRDLPKSKLGIDIEHDFEPQYIAIRGKGDIIKELKKEAKNAAKVFLATDPDREGEAISWHLAFLLGIDQNTPCRIVFNEITKKAVQAAIKNPRPIDLKLVDAQQARRVLDRLVGYQISPLLWRKVRRGLSAGRVQSAALKIICDRENEIKAFIPKEYWNITAELKKGKKFTAKLAEYNGKKLTVENKEQADEIVKVLKAGEYMVKKVEEKERARKPYAPFTTSSLQQEASTKLGFYTKKTMLIAQQLYEGIEIKGHGTVGLVSYIRTDSVRISDEAKAAAKEYIFENLGAEYYQNNVYSNKKKDVQDAHEAIRPSYIELEPDEIKDSLSKDQYNLYKLIWSRFMASQMSPAKFMGVSAAIDNSDYMFKATGSKLIFDGFLKVYSPGKEDDSDKLLPHLEKGEKLELVELLSEQNFTQPPARFTEASLVKDLEEKDIGRPSTYAPIIATIIERKYVNREKKTLTPTELGFIVTQMMEEYFKEIVDTGFTADMEDKLDAVEVKDVEWKDIIRDYYGTLEKELETADKEIKKVEFEVELTGELCEKCGKPMAVKHGRFGEFAACTGYPECKNTKPIVKSTNVKCPNCGKDIVARKSKTGRVFYGCSGYPECQQSYWNKPIDRKCPKCGSLLVEKKTKTSKYACSNSECDYKEE